MIENNILRNNENGISIEGLAGINQNTIRSSNNVGIWVKNTGIVTLNENYIAGNNKGITISGGIVELSENTILSNGIGLYFENVIDDVFCGDNVVNREEEECDDPDLNYGTCAQYDDYTGGKLGCTSDCKYDFIDCEGPTEPYCGDGVINRIEELCDGDDLDGKTCHDLGFVSGDLLCNLDCASDLVLPIPLYLEQ